MQFYSNFLLICHSFALVLSCLYNFYSSVYVFSRLLFVCSFSNDQIYVFVTKIEYERMLNEIVLINAAHI